MPYDVRTFVLTDLAGSTELWDLDPVNMERALETHDDLVADVVERLGGTLVRFKGEGDSTFSVFADPAAAVNAARRIVETMDVTPWPTVRPLSVRIGVHVGPAQHRGLDWFGAAVNRAARLRALAPPGGVFISGPTAASVRGALPAETTIELLGRRRLRGFREREDIWAVSAAGEIPPVLLPDGADGNVGQPHHELLGRDAEVDQVEELVRQHRLVTVSGGGGIGKTRLAVEVALRSRDGFADGVWFIDLAAVDAGAVLPFVLSQLGLPESSGPEWFAEQQCLLVLDNCEHVLDDVAQMAVLLLRSAPRVRILATSRHPLGVTAEKVLPLRPFRVPSGALRLDELQTYAAFDLFVERARQHDPSFAVDASEAEALSRCLTILDGMPLAIEIAASLTRSMSLSRLVDLLERDLPALRSAYRDTPERHRSVAATVEWSLALLDPPDREAMEALSVCRGFDAETAAAVTDRSDTEQMLCRLVDASLVVATDDDRYRILEPVRQHVGERLAGRSGVDQCAERLASRLTSLARRSARRLFGDPSVFIALRHEAGNVEQTLTWLLDHGHDCDAVTLVGALGHFWCSDDQVTGRRWLGRVEPLFDQCDDALAAPARLALGMHYSDTGADTVVAQLTRALETFESNRRPVAAATAAFWLARTIAIDDRVPTARTRPPFERSLELARQAEQPILTSWSLIWLAILAKLADDIVAAERHLRDAIEVSVAAGVIHPLGQALDLLARLAYERKDVPEAGRLADRAVATNRRSGDNWQLAQSLKQRADLRLAEGDLTQAALDVNEAADFVGAFDEFHLAETLAITALLLDALGQPLAATSAVESLRRWMDGRYAGGYSPIWSALNRVAPPSSADELGIDVRPIRGALHDAIARLNQSEDTTPT